MYMPQCEKIRRFCAIRGGLGKPITDYLTVNIKCFPGITLT